MNSIVTTAMKKITAKAEHATANTNHLKYDTNKN